MLLTQAANVATAAGLFALMLYGLDALQTWHIFVAAFIQGTTKAVEDPSRRTGIFDIVGRDRLVNAMSLDVISQNVGKMIGPVIGGILIQFSGYPVAYIFVIFVHADNLWLISRLRIPDAGPRAAVAPMWQGLGNSFAFAWKSRVLVGMLSITIVMNALAFPLQQFIPAVGKELLMVGPALVGTLVAADGFGHLAGAAVVASHPVASDTTAATSPLARSLCCLRRRLTCGRHGMRWPLGFCSSADWDRQASPPCRAA